MPTRLQKPPFFISDDAFSGAVCYAISCDLVAAVGSWPTFEGAYREKGQANCPLAHKHINEFYFSGMFL